MSTTQSGQASMWLRAQASVHMLEFRQFQAVAWQARPSDHATVCAPQDVVAARLSGHSTSVTAVAMQASGCLVASLDVAGTAMVWVAASLLPVACVPSVCPSAASDGVERAGTASSADVGRDGRSLSGGGALTWLPAPDAVVGMSANGKGGAADAGNSHADELLLAADRSSLRLLHVPADAQKRPMAPLAEAASALMPEGCTAVHQLTAVTSEARSSVKATVYGRADVAGDGPIVLRWQLTSPDEGQKCSELRLHPAGKLHFADIAARAPADNAALQSPPQFAELLSHAIARLAITQAGSQISLYSLSNAAAADNSLSIGNNAALEVRLLAAASLDSVGPTASSTSATAPLRTANGTSQRRSVSAVALSASGRHLAAAGQEGATGRDCRGLSSSIWSNPSARCLQHSTSQHMLKVLDVDVGSVIFYRCAAPHLVRLHDMPRCYSQADMDLAL